MSLKVSSQKSPKVLNVADTITVHGQMNVMSSSVSAPELEERHRLEMRLCRMVTVQRDPGAAPMLTVKPQILNLQQYGLVF